MSARFTHAGVNDLLVKNKQLLEDWHEERFGKRTVTNNRVNTLVAWGLSRKRAQQILAQVRKETTPPQLKE